MSHPSLTLIRSTLEAGLAPLSIELEDESHRHAGHAHNRARADGGVTHLKVRVVAETFRGKSRIERHRIVNALLAGEIAGGLHALTIDAKAPGE